MHSHSYSAQPNLTDMIIYKITNLINGKRYIGQTVRSLKSRWVHHCTPNSLCRYLSAAIHKYGKENFKVEVIATCSSMEEMNHREQYYIRILNTLAPNGYNLMTGGENSKPSLAVIEKRSSSLKEYYRLNSAKPVSQETRRKLSVAGKGKKLSAQHKEKLQELHSVPVYQYGGSGIFIAEYSSAANAYKHTGINNSEIGKACKGKRRLAGGYQWSYLKAPNMGMVKKIVRPKKHGKPTTNKAVAKINREGKIENRYPSVKEAALANKCDISDVSKVCRGKLKQIKGNLFIFI